MKITEIFSTQWMLRRENMAELLSICQTHLHGPKINIKDMATDMGLSSFEQKDDQDIQDGVAVVPLSGILTNKPTPFMRCFFGMASMVEIGNRLKELAADDRVKVIILDIDSPGGTVSGTTELADLVHEISKSKKVVTLANDLMASAALFIGSAASEVYISSPMAQVGSIGVATIHADASKFYESFGVGLTDIFAGKYKRIATDLKPLSDEGKEYIQDTIDQMYTVFVERVAKYRGLKVDAVIATEARVYTGEEAIKVGLVDGVSTLDDLVKKLSQPDGVPIEGNQNSITISEDDNDMDISMSAIKKDHPEVYAQIVAEGKEEATKEGAKAETARIQGIEAHAMAGHEKLVETMKFDGTTTPDQAAAKILTAEKGKLSAKATDIEADETAVVLEAEPGTAPVEASTLSVEDQCKKNWGSDPKVKAEFSSLETYTAYTVATSEGRVKLVSK